VPSTPTGLLPRVLPLLDPPRVHPTLHSAEATEAPEAAILGPSDGEAPSATVVRDADSRDHQSMTEPTRQDMTEPTRQEMLRAAAALGPFVRRWRLSLNPEDLEELAYAVLCHARTDEDVDTIEALVEQQINEHEAKTQQLRDAMQAHLNHRRDPRMINADDGPRQDAEPPIRPDSAK
jgi:hypothetical protein